MVCSLSALVYRSTAETTPVVEELTLVRFSPPPSISIAISSPLPLSPPPPLLVGSFARSPPFLPPFIRRRRLGGALLVIPRQSGNFTARRVHVARRQCEFRANVGFNRFRAVRSSGEIALPSALTPSRLMDYAR
jgi:hypothetical protein